MDEITLNDDATSNEEVNPVEATTPLAETPSEEIAMEEKPKTVKKVKAEKAVANEIHAEAANNGAHDDFDWSVDKRNVSIYNPNDRGTYDKLYEDTFKAVNEN